MPIQDYYTLVMKDTTTKEIIIKGIFRILIMVPAVVVSLLPFILLKIYTL
jgi:hypothetical protein